MNGRKAKEIRHEVYKDGSKRNEYKYKRGGGLSLTCIGKRAEYLKLKKEYLRVRRMA